MVLTEGLGGQEPWRKNLAFSGQSGAYRSRGSETLQTENLRLTDDNRNHSRRRFSRDRLPNSRSVRVALGTALVIMGIFGWLPIIGFWMIPLGLLVLSVDFHYVRRFRRRLEVWLGGRRRRRQGRNNKPERSRDE